MVGADGIRSRLRGTMGPVEPTHYTGQVAWRALIPVDALPPGTVPPTATVWLGAGRHLVSYCVRGGALVNIVAVLERPNGRRRGGACPATRTSSAPPMPVGPSPVPTLLRRRRCFLWGLFDRPELVRWVRDRLALIGDAAHPMLPFLAQGAAMWIEDGAALVRHLCSTENVPAALAA